MNYVDHVTDQNNVVHTLVDPGGRELLNDTVGWTGKNLFSTKLEHQSITNTGQNLNNDSTIRARTKGYIPVEYGKTYVFSATDNTLLYMPYYYSVDDFTTDCVSYGSYVQVGNSITIPNNSSIKYVRLLFKYSNDAYVNLNNINNIQFEEGDTPTSYMPYHPSVELSKWDKSSQKVAGAYNLLPNNGVSTVNNGVTFTVNSDGTVTKTGSVDSSHDAALIQLYQNHDENNSFNQAISSGNVKCIMCPSGGSDSTYYGYFRIRRRGTTTDRELLDYGDGAVFDGSEWFLLQAYAVVISKTDTSTLVFKPMLTPDLNATYDDYVPYCMSNRELMEDASPVYAEQNGVSSFSKTLEVGKSYIFYTAGGAGAYNYAWLAHPVLPTYTYITQLAAGTNPNVTISSSGTTVTVSCSSTTITMGYYKV